MSSAYTQISMIEAAAVFIATLAFPTQSEKAARLAQYLINVVGDHIATWSDIPTPELEQLCVRYPQGDRKKGNAVFRHATEIISSKRLIAAEMARPELHAACFDQLGWARPVDVPTHCSQEMITEISMYLAEPTRQRDKRGRKATGGESECNKANIHRRCWQSSLPVLHMALALRAETISANRSGFDAIDLFSDADLTYRLLLRSLDIAPAAKAKFGIKEQSLVLPC